MYATIIKFNTLSNTIRTASQYNDFLLFRLYRFVGGKIVAHKYKIGQKYISQSIYPNFYRMVFHQLYLFHDTKLIPAGGKALASFLAAHFPVLLRSAGAKFEYIVAVGGVHVVNHMHEFLLFCINRGNE